MLILGELSFNNLGYKMTPVGAFGVKKAFKMIEGNSTITDWC
jgi:hypothetical protein